MRTLLIGVIAALLMPASAAAQVYGQIPTAQVSVGTTATLVASAKPGRKRVMLTVGAANTCAFGPAGITTTTGFPLQPTAGATLLLLTNNDVYAVCSATTTIGVLEEVQ